MPTLHLLEDRSLNTPRDGRKVVYLEWINKDEITAELGIAQKLSFMFNPRRRFS